MKRVAFAAAAALALSVLVASPAGARHATASVTPGTWCGGTLWKLMTLSDTGKGSVNWAPAGTSIGDLGALTPPKKIVASRNNGFEKQTWSLTAVIERYRMASNGEIVFELYSVPSNAYMNAYLPNPKCLSKKTRGRSQIVAARTAFTSSCPMPSAQWQTLGTTVSLTGVGFWNPVKTTLGALANGAELRPVTGLTVIEGCGHFG
jgi:hypothetical protein